MESFICSSRVDGIFRAPAHRIMSPTTKDTHVLMLTLCVRAGRAGSGERSLSGLSSLKGFSSFLDSEFFKNILLYYNKSLFSFP